MILVLANKVLKSLLIFLVNANASYTTFAFDLLLDNLRIAAYAGHVLIGAVRWFIDSIRIRRLNW